MIIYELLDCKVKLISHLKIYMIHYNAIHYVAYLKLYCNTEKMPQPEDILYVDDVIVHL